MTRDLDQNLSEFEESWEFPTRDLSGFVLIPRVLIELLVEIRILRNELES